MKPEKVKPKKGGPVAVFAAGKTFYSISEAAAWFGVCTATVSAALKADGSVNGWAVYRVADIEAVEKKRGRSRGV